MANILPLELQQLLETARTQHSTITLVTGVFDILHHEHQLFLQKAKALGGVLIIGIESDVRVRQMKGEGRPVNSQEIRKEKLEKWQIADAVFILPEDFSRPEQRENLIKEVRPTFLAVSSHTDHQDKKSQLVEKYGGKLMVVHQYNPEVSTTKILAAA